MATLMKQKTKTKVELVKAISDKTQIPAIRVKAIIQTFLDEIIDTLAEGDRLEFRDFGVFEVVLRRPKVGRNPRNASIPITIPAKYVVRFTAGKKIKEKVELTPS